MSDLTEFHCFPKLPPEIRVRIWNFAFIAIRTPRIVQLIAEKITADLDWIMKRRTIPPIPLLYVCRESEHEVLEKERREKMFCFKGPLFDSKGPIVQFYGCLFDPEMDVLMVDMKTADCLAKLCGNDLLELQYVALYDRDVQFASYEDSYVQNDDFSGLCALYQRLVADQEYTKLQWMNFILEDEVPGSDLLPGWDICRNKSFDRAFQYENVIIPNIQDDVGFYTIRNADNKVSPRLNDEPDGVIALWSNEGSRDPPELRCFSELLENLKARAVGCNIPRLVLPQRNVVRRGSNVRPRSASQQDGVLLTGVLDEDNGNCT